MIVSNIDKKYLEGKVDLKIIYFSVL